VATKHHTAQIVGNKPENKRCLACERTKPLSEFYVRVDRNRSRGWQVTGRCKLCEMEHQRAKRRLVIGHDRRGRPINCISLKHAKNKLGIGRHEYEALLNCTNQCQICGETLDPGKREPHIDHCHETGRIRGLLCSKCNPLLGMARDSADILRRAAAYLESDGSATAEIIRKAAQERSEEERLAKEAQMLGYCEQVMAVIDREMEAGQRGATAGRIRMMTHRLGSKMWSTKRLKAVTQRLIDDGQIERVQFRVTINPKCKPCQLVTGYRRRKLKLHGA
jgi:hypothetical protein